MKDRNEVAHSGTSTKRKVVRACKTAGRRGGTCSSSVKTGPTSCGTKTGWDFAATSLNSATMSRALSSGEEKTSRERDGMGKGN